ncbi:phage tail spike protein [Salinicoccus roseus]|uniref:phage tail spike protein n=1 Tax=Salinicoccus roseus TaxID=45670 RepID=UPI00230134DB|nr:phage tail spike protein [Salinicoccus roseus]
MIYLFNKAKNLQGMLPYKNFIDSIQTVELNGLYMVNVELPLFYWSNQGQYYNHKKKFDEATFIGHFDQNKRFQMYKIHSRKVDNENLLVEGIHIFFDEAKASEVIRDRRFTDSEVKPAVDAVFNPIDWYVKGYDVTQRLDCNFYYETPVEARRKIIETWNVEIDFGLTFDGKKIVSKDLYVKKKLGKWTGKRFAYGSNLLSISQEQSEAEVVTAVIGRGKGVESGDGYGRRISFSDISWSKDGITKPAGQDYIEMPAATAEYGYVESDGSVKPRIGVVEFEDIEDKTLLANATYNYVLQNCVPKVAFDTTIAETGALNLGDEVGIIYKQVGIVKSARVQKLEINLLNPKLTKVSLGDYQHFKKDKAKINLNRKVDRIERDNQSYITQLKNDFDVRYDAQATAIENAYQQAVIDANAETAAAEERMNTALSTQWSNTESAISTAKTEAIDSANAYSDDVESRLNTSINTQRTEIESAISTAKTDAISQAESDATQKAGAVQDNLETYKQNSQQRLETLAGGDVETVGKSLREVINDLESKVGSLEFGETKESLQKQLDDAKAELDGLEVGGENIVRHEDYSGSSSYQSIIKTGENFHISSEPIYKGVKISTGTPPTHFKSPMTVYPGEVLTASVYVKHEESNSNESTNIIFYDYGNRRTLKSTSTNGTHLEWTRLIVTYENTLAEPLTVSVYFYLSRAVNDVTYFTSPQVEYGNIATNFKEPLEKKEQKITTINESLEYVNGQLSAKLEQTDIDPLQDSIVEHTTKLEASAESIGLLQEKNELHEGDISTLQTNFETQAGEISTLLSKTGEHESKITDIEANYEGISASVGDLSDWKSQKGSVYDQTADAVSTKVWSSDIESATAGMEGRNLILGTQGELVWELVLDNLDIAPIMESGEKYIISFEAKTSNGTDRMYMSTTTTSSGTTFQRIVDYMTVPDEYTKYSFTFTAQEGSEDVKTLMINNRVANHPNNTGVLYIKHLRMVKGTKALPYSPAPEDFLQHTDFELRSDGFLLGTTHVGGEEFATAIVGDATGMSMIADNVDFSNNITVQNQIKSWSIESVKADFASATIDYLTTGVIKNAMLDSEVVSSDKLLVNSAMVDKFTANTAFIEDVKALSVEAAKGSFGDIVAGTADLQFIENKHLATESVDADKLLVDSALVNKLTVNTAFISDIKAMSIEAVEADISSIRSQILTSDVILSEHINASMALIDKLFSAEAYISTLTSKSAFIRDINAIEVTANSVILNTMLNRMGQVEGGLSIRRPDGAVYVNNGVPNHSLAMQRNQFMGDDVNWNGMNYYGSSPYYHTFENIYTYHDARYMVVAFAVSLGSSSPSASAYVNVRVREFGNPGTNLSQTKRTIAYRSGDTQYVNITMDLGIPQYEPRQFYLEFSLDGSNSAGNIATVRVNRAIMRG